jgi:hypothetical protein
MTVASASCCGEVGPCDGDGKRPFVLDHPGILSFKEESAASIFYWDPVERGSRHELGRRQILPVRDLTRAST